MFLIVFTSCFLLHDVLMLFMVSCEALWFLVVEMCSKIKSTQVLLKLQRGAATWPPSVEFFLQLVIVLLKPDDIMQVHQNLLQLRLLVLNTWKNIVNHVSRRLNVVWSSCRWHAGKNVGIIYMNWIFLEGWIKMCLLFNVNKPYKTCLMYLIGRNAESQVVKSGGL